MMREFSLSDDDMTIIGEMERDDATGALTIFWRYLGSDMGFDPETVEALFGGRFRAMPSTASAIDRNWSEDLGGSIRGDFVLLDDGAVICSNGETVGFYESMQAFDSGEWLASVMV